MEWRFGIARNTDKRAFEELCAAASAVTGTRFVPHTVAGYGDLVTGLREAEVGLAWLPPIPALDAVDRHLAAPLAVPTRHGQSTYLAALVVRARGPQALDALRGRRVAWVQRESAAGYLVPRMHLAAEGFDVLRFFGRELFVNSHGAVIDAVVNGDADVGATFCRTDSRGKPIAGPWIDANGVATRPVDVLATMGPIPNDALFVSPDVPAAARTALVRWLLALDRDPIARALFARVLDASDFKLPTANHFDALRHLIRTAHARGTR